MSHASSENKMLEPPIMVSRQNINKYFDGISPKTLANWHTKGIGPKPYNVGGRLVFYRVADVQSYLEGRRHVKTYKSS